MIIQDFPDLGVSIELQNGLNNVPVVNVVTAKTVQVQVNGRAVSGVQLRKPNSEGATVEPSGNADHRLRPTFWNPDGTQTTAGTVDLRGEE